MVAYIIGVILVVIALIIVGLILRKRIYDEVDKHESWKMDIMNRNVTTELQRVKSLNLSGETQEKFEGWKVTWDQILTRKLPDIEEFLLDAEEAADRFRVSEAKKNLKKVEQVLQNIELTIEEMFVELDQLLDSEKQSRKEVEEVQPQIKHLRRELLQNRHLYGKAEVRFEVEINALQQLLDQYFSAIDLGNYFEAKQFVADLKTDLNQLTTKIEEFPIIYKKCNRELPEQIRELLIGVKEMKEQGYRIEHLGFEKELIGYQNELEKCLKQLANGDVEEIPELLQSFDERVNEIYALLEKEAQAKSYIEKHLINFKKLIEEVTVDFDATNEEVELLQQTYYLEESDLELYSNLEKWIHQLQRQLDQIETDLKSDKQTYVALRDQLETSYKDLQHLQASHQDFKEQVRTIRKDELEAKKKVAELKRNLFDTNKKLQKSNIPGVPSFLWNRLDEASTKSNLVMEKLSKQPLDMGQVQHVLIEAETSVQTMIEDTNVLLEQAYLVETVIQYANRYRSKYPLLAAQLAESEKQFREYAYEGALETAANALEEIEPGALKRLETLIQVPS